MSKTPNPRDNMATAESVSARINTIRNCTIEIKNMSNVYNLINPQVYTFSGHCCNVPEPTISSNKTGVCAFTKTQYSARGAVGVLTYDLYHTEDKACSERMAILFSVPFDYVLYDGMLAVGVFEITRECDKALYYSMYEGKQICFIRENAKESGITYKGETVELKATMSNVGKAIIKLDIVDVNYASDVPDVPDVPDIPDISDVPDVSGVPDVSDVPDKPDIPEVSVVPNVGPVVEVKQYGNCCSKFCPFLCYRYCCNCFDK